MTHHTQPATGPAKPDDVTALEAAYGAPSQAGFGSAVFYECLQATDDLDEAARQIPLFRRRSLGSLRRSGLDGALEKSVHPPGGWDIRHRS